jgi:hypothetical protein
MSQADLRAHRDHERRKRDCSHTDPTRRELNRTLVGAGDAVEDVERHVQEHGAVIRPNVQRPYIGLVLTTSPAWFAEAGEDGVGAWVEATMGHLRSRWGDDLVSASVHRDEETPHVHAVVCPLHRYKTPSGRERVEVSPRQAVGPGREALSKLQDEYAWYLEGLTIARGKRGSRARHVQPKRWWAEQLGEAERERAAAIADRVAAAGELEAARSDRTTAAAERRAAERDRTEAATLLEQACAMKHAAAELLERARQQAAALLAEARARASTLLDDVLDALLTLAPEARNRHREVVERAERTAQAEGVTPSMAERALTRLRKQAEQTR